MPLDLHGSYDKLAG